MKKNEIKNDFVFKPIRVIGKYYLLIESIYKNVGEKKNIKKYYNCVTRLRLVLKDKNLVNIEAIKKNNSIKGVVWNGEELQIIIGANVKDVKNEFDNFIENLKNNKIENNDFEVEGHIKRNIWQNILAAFSGIFTPAIPLISTTGLLLAFQTIFVKLGLINDVALKYNEILEDGTKVTQLIDQYDLFSGMFYIINVTGIVFIGLFIGANTVKFLKGNMLVFLLTSIIISSPMLYGGQSWVLFNIGQIPIKIQSYSNLILPQICAAFIFVYFNKFVESWMPKTLDLIFRHLLVTVFTVLTIFFVVGPVTGIIESFIFEFIKFFGEIPFGIGLFIFTFLWQILVLSGTHVAINSLLTIELAQNAPVLLFVGIYMSMYGQIGAAIGVGIKTKSSTVRSVAASAVMSGAFGITEPAIYGINIIRIWPFLYGCIGGAIGAFVSQFFGTTIYIPGIVGFFGVLSVFQGGVTQIIGFLVASVISITLPAAMVIFFSNDFKNFTRESKKNIEKMISVKSVMESATKTEIRNKYLNEISNFENLITIENKQKILNYKKDLTKISILEHKANNIKTKFELKQEILSKKINNFIKTKNQKKYLEYLGKYNDLKVSDKFNILNEEIDNLKTNSKFNKDEYENLVAEYTLKSNNLVESLFKENDEILTSFKNRNFNTIHSLEIIFQIEELLKTKTIKLRKLILIKE